MIEKLRASWRSSREKRRQYQLERALYKMNGGPTGPFATTEHVEGIVLETGEAGPRVEAPKGKAPGPGPK